MIELAGQKYYHDKRTGYYKTAPGGERRYLHRAIWNAEYGNIPHGWHVHHKDENPDNNSIENLECMPMRDHVHGKHRPEKHAICQQCGEDFVYTSPFGGKFCSHRCGTNYHNARRYA